MAETIIYGDYVDLFQFLPAHLHNTPTGILVRSIQDYFNEMYEYKKDATSSFCKLSSVEYKKRLTILGKIASLSKMYDAKEIDHDFIGRLASILGYDFGIATSEFMEMVALISVGADKNIPLDTTLEELISTSVYGSACLNNDPVDKATEFIRQVLIELPYWYSIKGTDKLAKILFWCFGISLKWEYAYTKNYSNENVDWVYTNIKDDNKLNILGYIPTSHVRASFGLDKSYGDDNAILTWYNNKGLSRVVETITSIKPINNVIDDVVFSFNFNGENSLQNLGINFSLGIDNYHHFTNNYTNDFIWDAGIGKVNIEKYKLNQYPVNYTFREQIVGEFLTGAYETLVAGSANESGINVNDYVFTLQDPEFYYTENDLVTLDVFPVDPSDYVYKFIYISSTDKTWYIVNTPDEYKYGKVFLYVISTGQTIDLT